MEEELRCYLCKEFYREPVLLPCGHALCRACAVSLQKTLQETDSSSATSGDYQEADKASVSSETDSGVVCGSRPNSYAGTPAAPAFHVSTAAFTVSCPSCSKQVYLDDNGAEGLPPFRVMRTIVERFGGLSSVPPAEEACQMCEGERRAAVVRCEQCSVRYCAACRDAWHPTRGPLAQHELRTLGTVCSEHASPPAVYCNTCNISICQRCLAERHCSHDTQPLPSAARAHKTELSQSLQKLSEQAKAVTEYIQLVKGTSDKINESCDELEQQIEQACAQVIKAVEKRKEELVRSARGTRAQAVANMRSLTSQAGQRLREATALLHFSIEALKETDYAAFLQVGSVLSSRAMETAAGLCASLESPPTAPALTLDVEPALRTVRNMNFVECIHRPPKRNPFRCTKREHIGSCTVYLLFTANLPTDADITATYADDAALLSIHEDPDIASSKLQAHIPPGAPEMAVESCCARGCSGTLAWRPPPPPAAVRGYVLELDDGLGGPFREVYCGRETVCTVDGLHYASLYSARVKAFNGAGEGPYSDVIGLQTSPVAWFTLDARCADSEGGLRIDADGLSARATGWQPRVALADTPLARGTHYWRISVDEYDGDADPAFGIARADVAKDKMLGSDALGWAMYIDGRRSWFVHGGAHGGRAAGGIAPGSTVGLLLDLQRGTLRFTVDDNPQGDIAFSGLRGAFYPAVSLNRGVAVTFEPGLRPPPDLLHAE
ncbi:E3 ubiquitin-protein ligase TRIM9 [Eumeta japonica]|uniref:E3 ubiquitin-protein ligase TRIM9 n=1 Tax=Eumeta variegata TaxID=151549 RepID=A0A4C1XHA0_EUMVA|nr:E3 ubiquitin-protein ligase TRIM9 [Eumeta japonica]